MSPKLMVTLAVIWVVLLFGGMVDERWSSLSASLSFFIVGVMGGWMVMTGFRDSKEGHECGDLECRECRPYGASNGHKWHFKL